MLNEEPQILKFKPRPFAFVGEALFIGLGCWGFYNYYHGHSIGDQRQFLMGFIFCLMGTLILVNTKIAEVDLTNGSITIHKIFYPKGRRYHFDKIEKVLIQNRRKSITSERGFGPDKGQFTLYFKSGKKVTVSRIFNTGPFEAAQGYLLGNYPDITKAY